MSVVQDMGTLLTELVDHRLASVAHLVELTTLAAEGMNHGVIIGRWIVPTTRTTSRKKSGNGQGTVRHEHLPEHGEIGTDGDM